MSKKRYPIEELTYRAQCYALARTTYPKSRVWVATDGVVFVKEPCAGSGDGWISILFCFDDPATAFKTMERHRMELVFADEEFRAIADDGTVAYGVSYADAIAGCAVNKVFGKKGIRIGRKLALRLGLSVEMRNNPVLYGGAGGGRGVLASTSVGAGVDHSRHGHLA